MTQELNSTPTTVYPIEQPFKSPLIITALLVLLPSLALYWFMGDSSSMPRAFKLFFGNWISPIILWFFSASFFHLWLKKGKLKKEQMHSQSLARTIFPALINEATDDKVELNKNLLTQAESEGVADNNLLISRLFLFLNHNDSEVDDGFGIKEKEQLKGSFALPRFMVWAIPILGFIGTVWGISNGIAHFSDAMTNTGSVTDVSSMLKENLPLVTNSLATAFDTTLLALLLSIPLMMLMLTIEKSEEAYLIDLDERWFHEIKPALQEKGFVTHSPSSQTSGLSASEGAVAVVNDSSKQVATEIKQLSTQVKALQETMEDLYETVFTSKLSSKK